MPGITLPTIKSDRESLMSVLSGWSKFTRSEARVAAPPFLVCWFAGLVEEDVGIYSTFSILLVGGQLGRISAQKVCEDSIDALLKALIPVCVITEVGGAEVHTIGQIDVVAIEVGVIWYG